MLEKDFDQWNELKKQLNSRERFPFARPREIWWCSIGLNIGVESDGKHENFERPVVVVRAYNAEMIKVVPLTTREKRHPCYFEIKHDTKSFAVLAQAKTISGKRLLRKIGKISTEEFKRLKEALIELG
jgi:mRNA interferase MazF